MSAEDPPRPPISWPPSEPSASPPVPDELTAGDAIEVSAETAWEPLGAPVPSPPTPAPSPIPPTPRRKEREPRPMPRMYGPGEVLSPLTDATRGLGLLFAVGASAGLGAWELRAGTKLLTYVQQNELAARGRMFVLADMFAAGAALCALALIYLLVKRRSFATAAHRVCEVGWRLSPWAMIGFVPLLLHWQLWVGRELAFLFLALIFALGLQALARAAFSSPPLGIWPRWMGRPRAAIERFADLHPRLVGALPLTLVLLGAAGYAIYFGAVTIISHHSLRTWSFDLGLEENILWNALHWQRPFFKSSPFGGPTATHFGNHATFISYPLSLVYAIAPRAETLLIIQAILVGGAAIPFFLYARRHVGAWTACLLAYAYLLYPPVHGANLYDFHYLPIGVFFLWTALYALDTRRTVLAVFAVLLALSTREDVAAGLAIVGGYLLLTGQRPRAGLVVAILGLGWFTAMKLVVMPRVAGGSSSFLFLFHDLVPSGETGFGGVLKTVLANPGYTLNTLLERDKLLYLLQIFTPIAFLPLRRPVGLLCCMLGFLFTLLSTGYAPLIQTSFQYTANWTTYLFMAMVGNLVWIARPLSSGDPGGAARRKAWVLAVAAATIVGSYQFGAVFQRNTIRGGFGPYTFGADAHDHERYAAVRELIKLVPPRAKIVASETLVPHVSNRPDAYTLRIGTYDAEYLLFALPINGDERTNSLALLEKNTFGVIGVKSDFVLAKRGAPTPRNAEIIARMK